LAGQGDEALDQRLAGRLVAVVAQALEQRVRLPRARGGVLGRCVWL
jgi:hypothetical protein